MVAASNILELNPPMNNRAAMKNLLKYPAKEWCIDNSMNLLLTA
jgi:hypothetical protein